MKIKTASFLVTSLIFTILACITLYLPLQGLVKYAFYERNVASAVGKIWTSGRSFSLVGFADLERITYNKMVIHTSSKDFQSAFRGEPTLGILDRNKLSLTMVGITDKLAVVTEKDLRTAIGTLPYSTLKTVEISRNGFVNATFEHKTMRVVVLEFAMWAFFALLVSAVGTMLMAGIGQGLMALHNKAKASRETNLSPSTTS
ncbi:MAG: hypothetical protein WC767_02745 [Candidatus Paceibacterota bacterium]|jgi:hypothetical protein